MPWGRIADPWRVADRADAYDLDKRDPLGPDQTPVLPGPWFHGSDRELPIGTILEPNHEPSKWNYNPTSSRYHPAGSPRKDWVFMSQHPGAARFWAPHVHRVEPLDEGPYSYNDELGQGYVSPRAKVVEYIPGNEDQMQEYAERMGIGNRVGSVYRAAQDWLGGVPVDPLDPKTTLHSFLLTPEDAYDQWDWERRHEEHPPIDTPNDVTWIHVSPNDLPVGTVLAPHHKPPWTDEPYNHGLDNRANWVWTEYVANNSDDWCKYMIRDHGECHVYRIKPRIGPLPWNGTAQEGWVTDSAVITERLSDHNKTSSLAPRRVAAAEHNGAMVALYPRADDAYKMAVANGEPVKELHLTLVYLGDDASELAPPDHLHLAIARLADAYTVIDAPIIGRAIFDEGAVVYLIGDNPQLPDLQTDVLNECHAEYNVPRQKHRFRPHVTIGYDITPRQLRFEGTVIFDRIGVAFGGKTKYFPLMGATVPEYSD